MGEIILEQDGTKWEITVPPGKINLHLLDPKATGTLNLGAPVKLVSINGE